MDNREYARQEKLRESLLHKSGLQEINEQESCGSHPSAHLWQDAYRQTVATVSKEQRSSQEALTTMGKYFNENRTDNGVQAMLGIGGATFAITAAVVESPIIIGTATLGAVACGGAFIWSGANIAMKHYTGRDLNNRDTASRQPPSLRQF
ncbi:hypothetical protein BH11CYA1_BH11CYA1_07040 [soil metagenome]